MPGFNKTGPLGEGPMTGRRMGRCTGSDVNISKTEGQATDVMDERLPYNFPGRGFGYGMGRYPGRGWGRGPCRGMGRGMGRWPGFRMGRGFRSQA